MEFSVEVPPSVNVPPYEALTEKQRLAVKALGYSQYFASAASTKELNDVMERVFDSLPPSHKTEVVSMAMAMQNTQLLFLASRGFLNLQAIAEHSEDDSDAISDEG